MDTYECFIANEGLPCAQLHFDNANGNHASPIYGKFLESKARKLRIISGMPIARYAQRLMRLTVFRLALFSQHCSLKGTAKKWNVMTSD
jgi:hypothetical protein